MKKLLFWMLILSQVFVSCKKESTDLITLNQIQNYPLAELKKSFAQDLAAIGSNSLSIKPNWAAAIYYRNENIYVVPANLSKSKISDNWECDHYLVFVKWKGEYIIDVLTILNKPEQSNKRIEYPTGLHSILVSDPSKLSNQTMRVSRLSLKAFLSLSIDQTTQPEGLIKKVSTRNASGFLDQNRNEEACSPDAFVCIDWYWVTYINGVLVDEEYAFTTCQCMTPGGGGSGGTSGNPPVSSCVIQGEAMVSQGLVVSQTLSELISGEDQNQYNIVYSWKIFSAGPWGIVSYEDATVRKIPSINNGYIKTYSSFTHRSIAAVGAPIGGTRSAQDMGATINLARSSAQVRIDFTVTHTPAGCLSVIIPYNANKVFHLVNNIVIE